MIGVANKILIPKKSQGWIMDDITTASEGNYGRFVDANSNYVDARSFAFSPDGTKVFILTASSPVLVYRYDLSVPWDATTMSYHSVSPSVYTSTNHRDIWVSPDGLILYLCRGTGKYVYGLPMSPAWDVTSLSPWTTSNPALYNNDGYANSLFIGGPNNSPFVMGSNYPDTSGWKIAEYSTFPINLSGDPGFVQYSANLLTYVGSFFFKSDGSKLYVIRGSSYKRIYRYILSTPWDISTAVYTTGDYYYLGDIQFEAGLYFKPDGTRFYIPYYSYLIEFNLTA